MRHPIVYQYLIHNITSTGYIDIPYISNTENYFQRNTAFTCSWKTYATKTVNCQPGKLQQNLFVQAI